MGFEPFVYRFAMMNLQVIHHKENLALDVLLDASHALDQSVRNKGLGDDHPTAFHLIVDGEIHRKSRRVLVGGDLSRGRVRSAATVCIHDGGFVRPMNLTVVFFSAFLQMADTWFPVILFARRRLFIRNHDSVLWHLPTLQILSDRENRQDEFHFVFMSVSR